MSVSAPLLASKRGLVMGVANERSIAWGIARALVENGAELAFTYQGETMAKRVIPLAKSVNASIIEDCDVTNAASMDTTFSRVAEGWGGLDFLVHAIAFSDRSELNGRYVDTLFDGIQQSGMNHEIVWNASNVASSVYFVKMVAGCPRCLIRVLQFLPILLFRYVLGFPPELIFPPWKRDSQGGVPQSW